MLTTDDMINAANYFPMPDPNRNLMQPVIEYSLHKRLGYKVSRLARLMEARLEARIGELGITRMMWCVLSGVGLEGVTTPSELAVYIGIARPTVSRLLRDMENKDLIRRVGAERDGRCVEIRMTDRGISTLQACRPLVDELNAHFGAKLNPNDLEAILKHLDTLAGGETRELTSI